jgi:hypothetical protein
MSEPLTPQNKTAQLHYRAAGNPACTLPSAAISNCFPGLDYDFKEFWRRAFVGIVLLEWDNYVVGYEDEQFKHLVGHRLLRIGDADTVVTVSGPQIPNGDPVSLTTSSQPGNPTGVVCMEWSNSLACIMRNPGQTVQCLFTPNEAPIPTAVPKDTSGLLKVNLTVRRLFDGDSVVPNPDLLRPGELTQSLCSPWQHDYRECSCYYWPASRPDYVNVVPTPDGISRGDNWISINRTGEYILDDRKDKRLVSYIDLFLRWEAMLRFQIKGRDAEES